MYEAEDVASQPGATEADKSEGRMASYWWFAIPSLLGIALFLVPVRIGGQATVLMVVAADAFKRFGGENLIWLLGGIFAFSAVASLVVSQFGSRLFNQKNEFIQLFNTSLFWLSLRIFGLVVFVCVITQSGPEWIWSSVSGGMVINTLAITLLGIFLLTPLLMPLLTDYGFMEFIGTLLARPFQFVFRLPGRSAIDCLASWLGAASVGVLITAKQYEDGYYSRRQASVIATNFSIVSLPFCYIVVDVVGLNHLFLPFYGTVMLVGLVAAIVVPKIPPLSRIPDSYLGERKAEEDSKTDDGVFRLAIQRAVSRASAAPSVKAYLKAAVLGVVNLWFGVLPIAISLATLSVAIVEFTPIVEYLSYPIVPLLNALGLSGAEAAAPAVLAGFAEMFLPALLIQDVESELTRFVIGALSVSQLIYMSEVGVLLLRSVIEITFVQLVQIFVIRTALALPIVTLIGNWIL